MNRKKNSPTALPKNYCACGHHELVHPNGPCEARTQAGFRCACRGFRERKAT